MSRAVRVAAIVCSVASVAVVIATAGPAAGRRLGAAASGSPTTVPAFVLVTPPTTTSPPLAIATTTRPSRTTTTTSPPLVIATTTRPPTVTTTTTSPPLVIATTTAPPRTTTTTSPPLVADRPSATVGPYPTYNPNPDGYAIQTTTTQMPEAQPPGQLVPDVSVRGIEVTQGIQDLRSRMPLVADRKTTVRVHIAVEPGFAFVDGALLVERAGQADVVLHPDNGPITPGLDRTDIDSALNFELDPELYTAGTTTFTAQVWSAGYTSIANEPDSANNLLSQTVQFHVAEAPTVWLIALDDGGGPGPAVNDLNGLLGFAQLVNADLLDYLPVASVDFEAYPEPVAPGPEAAEPGLWNLGLDADDDDTAFARRHEPNQRMAFLAELGGFLSDGTVIGLVDASIPTGGYSGWAGYGVSWSKPSAGTPAHEVAHTHGLDHVNCLGDTDGDGIAQEAEGGTIDWSHPTGLPPVCSLAPINPDGYFGFTNYRSPVTIYSNDPTHPQAAFPFMGYRSPGWADPYHWCRMLDHFGVPCNPALIGVAPVNPFVQVDCDPEPVGNGFQLDLCLADELPPNEPLVQPNGVTIALAETADGQTLELLHDGFAYLVPLQPPSWILVSGEVDLAVGAGAVGHAQQRDDITPVTAARFSLTIDGVALGATHAGLALRLVDGAGTTLATVPLAVDGAGHGNGADHGTTAGFFSPIPWVDGAATLELLVDGAVVDTIAIAPTAPTVADVTVEPTGDGGLVVRWSAGDDGGNAAGVGPVAPGEPIYDVLWSSAGGPTGASSSGPIADVLYSHAGNSADSSWMPVAVGLTATELTIPANARLPGGDDIRIQVVATVGVRSSTAVSAPFSAPHPPPLISIAGAPARAIEHEDEIEIHGISFNAAQAGADELSFVYRLLGDAPIVLGEGPVMRTRELPVGSNKIELTVTDRHGNIATTEIVIEVVERTTPTRRGAVPDPAAVAFLTADQFAAPSTTTRPPAPDTDGDGLDDEQEAHYGSDPTDVDTDGDGLVDGEEVFLGTDPTNADSDGDGVGDLDEAGAGTNPLDPADHP